MPQETLQYPKTTAKTAFRLMEEYTKKMHDLAEQAKRIGLDNSSGVPDSRKLERRVAEWHSVQRLRQRLSLPMRELAQHVSQLIEHGKVDELTQIELRLRLAEFESALDLGNELYHYDPSNG